jgi:hypothetical protein
MRRSIGLGVVLAALAGPAAPAAQALTSPTAAQALTPPARSGAQALTPHVDVGIGDNNVDFLADARFLATGIKHVRLIVPYDIVRTRGWELARADEWLTRARNLGLEPFVTFGHSDRRKQQFKLPSVAQYAAGVRAFRDRYPWVREFGTWNEANLVSVQPTGRHPRRAAAYYRALRRQCAAAGCRVVAVEVLLTGAWRTWRWLRRFREHAGRGPHVFGLHNYPDATRLRFRNTQRFLRIVPRAEVWFTETGGVVRFKKRWPYNEGRAARAVRHVFRLAAISPRITRVYLYNWRADGGHPRWDSGFISADGVERRAFSELLAGLRLDRFRPLPVPVFPESPSVTPVPVAPARER